MSSSSNDSKLNFTEKEIDNLPPPVGRRYYFWNTQVRSLALDVTSSGRKTFYVS